MNIAPGFSSDFHREDSTRLASDHSWLLRGLTALALIGFAVGLYLGLFYAGTDISQGHVQRIFYLHLPAFAGASAAFFTALVGGVAYLRTRSPRWDRLSLAGVEVGLMCSIITLVTGMIWAQPTWNTWWTWDPRLTSAAIMALTYAAYFMMRGALDNADRRRTYSAVYSVLAISTVIFTVMITRMRSDTIHPVVIGASPVNAQGSFAMAENMGMALGVNIVVWLFLITPALIWWRIRLEALLERIELKRMTAFDR